MRQQQRQMMMYLKFIEDNGLNPSDPSILDNLEIVDDTVVWKSAPVPVVAAASTEVIVTPVEASTVFVEEPEDKSETPHQVTDEAPKTKKPAFKKKPTE